MKMENQGGGGGGREISCFVNCKIDSNDMKQKG